MTTRIRNSPVKRDVVGFDAETVVAPTALRCSAFLIDYLLLLIFPVLGLVLGRLIGYDGSRLLNSAVSNVGWTIAFIIGVVNLVVLPYLTGATAGKMLTGLRIVTEKGEAPSIGAIALRHSVGYLLSALPLGAGFLAAILGTTQRTFHDRLTGTAVIMATERVEESD